jgi:hypothetical protein
MGQVTKFFQLSVSSVVTVWVKQHALSGGGGKKPTVFVFLSVLCEKLVAAHFSSH